MYGGYTCMEEGASGGPSYEIEDTCWSLRELESALETETFSLLDKIVHSETSFEDKELTETNSKYFLDSNTTLDSTDTLKVGIKQWSKES